MTKHRTPSRILVTGGTGFVGSHLVRELLRRGCDVAVLMRPTSDAWRLADVLDRVRRIEGDMDHVTAARAQIAAFAPQVTAHLAWFGVSNRHRDDPAQGRNVSATAELVALVHEVGCDAFIGLGSQAEYGPHDRAIDETATTQPRTLYGAAKLATCILTEKLCEKLGLRFAWMRLFSSYGPMDGPDWLLPYIITRMLRGQPVDLTPGEQQWDYIFVEDAAAALADVVQRDTAQGIYNLGSGRVESIRRIVEQVRDRIDVNMPLNFGARSYGDDQVMHLQANIARLQRDTGWSPRVALAQGLARTVDWYAQAKVTT